MGSDIGVRIFDTTLRDGEQAAGINLDPDQKVEIAQALARLKVDVIEAGFPAASRGDLEGTARIARTLHGPIIAGLARTRIADIEAAYEAVRHAERPRIHVFIATSPIHMERKLRLTPKQVLEEVKNGVSAARRYLEDVEFSAEDASRSDPDFLVEVFKTAIEAGATTLNIPDTVGYALPEEFAGFVKGIMERVAAPSNVILSVHCHDDLGLAVANSLSAISVGVRQVECTINGLGERAGNASLEEIVMALKVRQDLMKEISSVDTTKLYATSRLVSRYTGIEVPPNKAIVGSNAFAHEAGIHQHGILRDRTTYEIMRPEDVGAPKTRLVLGKHSGRHAFYSRLEELGYSLTEEDKEKAFVLFKELCDRKKQVSDGDIEALVVDEILNVKPEHRFSVKSYSVQVSSGGHATATVTLKDGEVERTDAATGNGPIDASYEAINRIVGLEPHLSSYQIKAVSGKSDAVGEASVTIQLKGISAHGRGASTDVIESSIKAYVNAINQLYSLAAAKEVSLNHGEENAS